jgi:TPP-dependent pyruvate/acetoin dehydrogenase alpha subunit
MTIVPVDLDHACHLDGEMLRNPRSEERGVDLFSSTEIRGFMHVYIGEEAVAGGVMQPLTPAAADHRVSDGMRGTRRLTTIDQLLQEPATS